MNAGRLICTQVTDMIHREQFDRCINLHPMPRASRSMTARDQFLAMAFAQITFREGLRGSNHLYATGIRGNITWTNLAYANEFRDWRVYEALAQILIRKVRRWYSKDANGLDIDEMVYAIDSSTIDLCLSLFPWATFRRTKGAIKLHTQLILKVPSPYSYALPAAPRKTSTSSIGLLLRPEVSMYSIVDTWIMDASMPFPGPERSLSFVQKPILAFTCVSLDVSISPPAWLDAIA